MRISKPVALCITVAFLTLFFQGNTQSTNCNFYDDFSLSGKWTQVGTGVSVSQATGYFNNASGGQQRRIHQPLGFSLDSNRLFVVQCKFRPIATGSYLGQPFCGAYPIALTTGNGSPYYNCPNVNCTGYPLSTKDMITVGYEALNPPDGELYLFIRSRHKRINYLSGKIKATTLNQDYFIQLDRLSDTVLQLSVFNDSNYTNHILGSPIQDTIPNTLFGMNTIQVGNATGGNYQRVLTGYTDNICVQLKDSIRPIARAKNDTVYLDASGAAMTNVQRIDNGSIDYSGIQNRYLNQQHFSCSDRGTNKIVLTVVDSTGNSDTAHAYVWVRDTIAPVIACPSDTILCEDSIGKNGAKAFALMPSLSDNCPGSWIRRTTGIGVGGLFPIGTTVNTYTAEDSSGNQSVCQVQITVHPIPQFSLGKDTLFCDSNRVNLTLQLPIPGTSRLWSDSSINSRKQIVNAGKYWCSVTAKGCLYSDTINIGIHPKTPVSLSVPHLVCSNDTAFVLRGGRPIGGVYSGTGVQRGNFYPNRSGLGQKEVVYHFIDGNGCSNSAKDTLDVKGPPQVVFPLLKDVCERDTAVTFSGVKPAGGTFTGVGISGRRFNPTIAGIGQHSITYRYTNAFGCSDTVIRGITVLAQPVVALSSWSPICIGSQPVALTGGTPFGGSYTGSGVSGTDFDPAKAGVGVHRITYTYTDRNGCTDSVKQNLKVNGLPQVSFTAVDSTCSNDLPVILTGKPIGGVFNGNGVKATSFDPVLAGVGVHAIHYTYKDTNGCSAVAKDTIRVNKIPVFTILGNRIGCGKGAKAPVLKVIHPNATYQWSTGVTLDSTYVYKNGPVWVAVTDTTTKCTATDTVNVSYEVLCVGIDEPLKTATVRFYPNPNNGAFHYQIEGISGKYVQMHIVNVLGKAIYQRSWSSVGPKLSGHIQLDAVESGVYFIHLITADGSVVHQLSITQ